MAQTVIFRLGFVDFSTDNSFDPSYWRKDEIVLGHSFDWKEGDFATLTTIIKATSGAPSLLSALRKQWAWFSCKVDDTIYPLFFGRVDGIQTVRSEDGPVATITLTAEPADYAVQKKALADTLRDLPRYDPVFIDPQERGDDNAVLDAYPVRYHVDPKTHVVTISNELLGEDGTEEFAESEMYFEGFEQEMSAKPSTSVTVNGLFNWTQQADGEVDLTDYLLENWPGGGITSYTFAASSWPSIGTSLGQGWKVANSTCREKYDLTVRNKSYSFNNQQQWQDYWNTNVQLGLSDFGEGSKTTEVSVSGSDDSLTTVPPGSITFGDISTRLSISVSYDHTKTIFGISDDLSSYSQSNEWSGLIIPKHYLNVTLTAGFAAKRSCTENVTVTISADLQPVIGSSAQGQSLDPIPLQTVDLSAPLDPLATDPDIPIGDPRLRSYICTDRGQQSLQYMIARGQTALLTASRCIEISFKPLSLERFFALTLRKNARITRSEIPGGTADGKIIGLHLAMEMGGNGVIDRVVTIGVAPGRGGIIETAAGDPTYVDDDYIEDDYQERTGVVESFDSSIGYTPPLFSPNDDGIDFFFDITADDVIEQALTVENPASEQASAIRSGLAQWFTPPPGSITNGAASDGSGDTVGQQLVEARTQAVNDFLDTIRSVMRFKLKSMTRSFTTDYTIGTTPLKVPQQIDLEDAA